MLNDYAAKVYQAEDEVAVAHVPRQLDKATVQELAARIVGAKVHFFDLTDDQRERGFIAGGIWWEGRPWLTFAEDRHMTDLCLAHEVGHLVADRSYNTGHGLDWLKASCAAARTLHRPEYAQALARKVGPIVVKQPESERLAALREPRY